MNTRLSLRTLVPALLLVAIFPLSWAIGQQKRSTTQDLSQRAEVIAHGKVRGTQATWEGKKERIVTYVTVEVREYLKGSGGGTLTVVAPGGELDGVGEWYSHSSRFKNDEEVVLFAEKDNKGRLRVSGGDRGKFAVERKSASDVATVYGNGPLEDFKKQIKSEAQSLKTN